MPQVDNDYWMHHAIGLAQRAWSQGEVPVGAVLVREGRMLGEGWNRSIADHDPCAHAEIMALRSAGKHAGNYRLPGSILYVTLEPCVMCIGAILHARIEQVFFGAYDKKTGAAGSVFNLAQDERHYHCPEVTGGVLETECVTQIQAFFRERREANKRLNKRRKDGA